MERRYRVSLLLIALRHRTNNTRVPQSLCRLPSTNYTNFVTLSQMEFKFRYRPRRSRPGGNLNINSRGICVALRPVGISRSTPPSHHYPFKCNIGKAFRDEGDYELSQPLKPVESPVSESKSNDSIVAYLIHHPTCYLSYVIFAECLYFIFTTQSLLHFPPPPSPSLLSRTDPAV